MRAHPPIQRALLRTLALWFGLFVAANADGTMAVPVKLQIALFTKLLGYDSKLAPLAGKWRVAVVHKVATDEVEAVVAAFRAAGVKAEAVDAATAVKKLDQVDVVYLFPGVDAAALAPNCAKRGVITVSGDAGFAERGLASMGLALKADGRPQVVINVSRLKLEGHDFPAQVLGLAKIVR